MKVHSRVFAILGVIALVAGSTALAQSWEAFAL